MITRPDGMTDSQFEEMAIQARVKKWKIDRGIHYFDHGVDIFEIVDPVETFGWECGHARLQGQQASANNENPYAGNENLNTRGITLDNYWREGYKSTHPDVS